MADDQPINPTDNSSGSAQDRPEESSAEASEAQTEEKKRPLSPEAEAVAANQPGAEDVSAEESQAPDLDAAKKELDESREKATAAQAEGGAELDQGETTAPTGGETTAPTGETTAPAEEEREEEPSADQPSAETAEDTVVGEPEKPAEPEEEKPALAKEEPSGEETSPEAQPAEEPEMAPESGKIKLTDPTAPVNLAPRKIGKEKKKKDSAKFLIIMGLIFAGLFVVFVVLMVFMIASGGADSPVLAALNLDAAGIRSFLLTVVNLSFGLLALLFFVLSVIGVFRMLFAKKGDKEAKKKGLRMLLIGIIPLVLVMIIWLFLYNFIRSIEISTERVRAEIIVLDPENLEGLQAPLEVTFSSENVIRALQNQGLNILDARWDFDGDGTFETEPTDFAMSYLYNNRGNYNVGFAVEIEGEDAPRVFLFPLVIGEAVFEAKPPTGTAPLDILFDAKALVPKGKKIQSMDWDFDGDGEYELTGKDNLRPRHTFEQIGVFNVHLRIVDENNLVENYYREIEIVAGDRPPLSAVIEATPGLSGAIPLQVRFDGGKSESVKGTIVNYEWDFGDGSPLQVGRSASHIYEQPGVYTATLTIREDSGKEASDSAEVNAKTVSSVPEARIQTTPVADTEGNLSGEIPFKVSFDGSLSTDEDEDIVDYEWDFGLDGAGQVGQKVDFTFEQAGNYTVTLTVRDADGQEDMATVSVEALEPGVRSVINANPQEGTAPLTVEFDGSTSSAFEGKIVSYEWDFGDGSAPTITGAKITHKYDQVGTYTVKLKVTTNLNETAESELLVYVREIPLKACYTPSRRSGEAPLAVTFDTKCSTGAVAAFSWDFGDGEASDSRKPAHTFENPGTYNVTLEVSDDKNNVNSFSDVIVAEGEVE